MCCRWRILAGSHLRFGQQLWLPSRESVDERTIDFFCFIFFFRRHESQPHRKLHTHNYSLSYFYRLISLGVTISIQDATHGALDAQNAAINFKYNEKRDDCAIARKQTSICLLNKNQWEWIFDVRTLNAHGVLWYDAIVCRSLGFTFARAIIRLSETLTLFSFCYFSISPLRYYGKLTESYRSFGVFAHQHRVLQRERRKRVFENGRRETMKHDEESERLEREGMWSRYRSDCWKKCYSFRFCFGMHLHTRFVRCN